MPSCHGRGGLGEVCARLGQPFNAGEVEVKAGRLLQELAKKAGIAGIILDQEQPS